MQHHSGLHRTLSVIIIPCSAPVAILGRPFYYTGRSACSSAWSMLTCCSPVYRLSIQAWHIQAFYSTTLEALAEAKNERLWFKTQLKLCGLWFKLNEYSRLARILKELHR